MRGRWNDGSGPNFLIMTPAAAAPLLGSEPGGSDDDVPIVVPSAEGQHRGWRRSRSTLSLPGAGARDVRPPRATAGPRCRPQAPRPRPRAAAGGSCRMACASVRRQPALPAHRASLGAAMWPPVTLAPTLRAEAHATLSVPCSSSAPWWRMLLAYSGCGAMISVGYMVRPPPPVAARRAAPARPPRPAPRACAAAARAQPRRRRPPPPAGPRQLVDRPRGRRALRLLAAQRGAALLARRDAAAAPRAAAGRGVGPRPRAGLRRRVPAVGGARPPPLPGAAACAEGGCWPGGAPAPPRVRRQTRRARPPDRSWARVPLWLMAEVAIVACDLAEVIGSAVALQLLLGLPLWAGVLLTAADVLAVMLVEGRSFRWLEVGVFALIAGIFGWCARRGVGPRRRACLRRVRRRGPAPCWFCGVLLRRARLQGSDTHNTQTHTHTHTHNTHTHTHTHKTHTHTRTNTRTHAHAHARTALCMRWCCQSRCGATWPPASCRAPPSLTTRRCSR